jgi:hypothetical protein
MSERTPIKHAQHFRQCPNPKCLSFDIRGPNDTPPSKELFLFTRSWYCIRCWWRFEQELVDTVKRDAGKAKAAATRRPSDRR